MIGVLKSGGKIVSGEADLDLFIIDAPDYEISRTMQRFICDSFIRAPEAPVMVRQQIQLHRPIFVC
jgi:hypothetical protein